MEILKQISPSSQPPSLIPSPNSGTKKKSRLSYSITFKLAAVRHAEAHGNRATARYLGINEKQIRDWRSKKTSLMNTNANAKRLKGAGRQSGSDSTKRVKSKPQKPINISAKPFLWQHTPPSKVSYSTQKPFSWWCDWASHNSVSIMNSANDLSSFNNNNNDYVMSVKNYGGSPSYLTSTSSKFPIFSPPELQIQREYEEKDYKERISCALALLELKSTSEKHHGFRRPLVTW